MMRRLLSLWLPDLAIDRLRRQHPGLDHVPLVTTRLDRGHLVLAAVNRKAAAAGLYSGLSLADARARVPDVQTIPADPAAERASLDRLARWAGRYSPWIAVEAAPENGLILDISGCGHLFGGDSALALDMAERLEQQGLGTRIAVAETPGAAWALARFGASPGPLVMKDANESRERLKALPVAALRLPPDVVPALNHLGLKRIGDLMALPRAALGARFGAIVGTRLDQMTGAVGEPITPRRPPDPALVREVFAEPIASPEAIAAALDRLSAGLAASLAAAALGARRVTLAAYRIDGRVMAQSVRLGRASRDPDHFVRLMRPRLDHIDPGFGIEVMTLAASCAEALAAIQGHLVEPSQPADALAGLIDRIDNRPGLGRVTAITARASHLPERAFERTPPHPGRSDRLAPAPAAPATAPRPVRLLAYPAEMEALAPIPDDPPLSIAWQGRRTRVRASDGPERIGAEWWRMGRGQDLPDRDFYRVEDAAGRRFWISRDGPYRADRPPPRWSLHGFFG